MFYFVSVLLTFKLLSICNGPYTKVIQMETEKSA